MAQAPARSEGNAAQHRPRPKPGQHSVAQHRPRPKPGQHSAAQHRLRPEARAPKHSTGPGQKPGDQSTVHTPRPRAGNQSAAHAPARSPGTKAQCTHPGQEPGQSIDHFLPRWVVREQVKSRISTVTELFSSPERPLFSHRGPETSKTQLYNVNCKSDPLQTGFSCTTDQQLN